jgi:hypothetical protein
MVLKIIHYFKQALMLQKIVLLSLCSVKLKSFILPLAICFRISMISLNHHGVVFSSEKPNGRYKLLFYSLRQVCANSTGGFRKLSVAFKQLKNSYS